MYLCYIDESGTSVVPGNTSHFVLAGLSIPIVQWKGGDLHKVDEYLDSLSNHVQAKGAVRDDRQAKLTFDTEEP